MTNDSRLVQIAIDALATDPGSDPDLWLQAAESRFADIRPGACKQIVWANPGSRQKTAVSIVFIHGFSASPGEMRPMPDLVARALGANLFFTRLAGHGRSGDAMGEARLEDWAKDLGEAIALGSALGDRAVIMASSTGASLATWGLGHPALAQKIAAAVFLSPNYRILAKLSFLLTTPLARPLLRILVGKRRSFEPQNERHRAMVTHDYPASVLIPMARLVQLASRSPVEQISIPALFLYSRFDQVVDPAATQALSSRWGGQKTVTDLGQGEDINSHVLAGDALGPSRTQPVADAISGWLRDILA